LLVVVIVFAVTSHSVHSQRMKVAARILEANSQPVSLSD